MKYLIMGAGALGSVIGGLLLRAGRSVVFVGRGPHFEHITTLGLVIDGLWGEHRLRPAPTVPDDGRFRADIILLCVKSFDTETACAQVRDLAAPDGLVVSVQNGLGNLEAVARVFGERRTIGARVIFGARVPTPGWATVTVYADRVLLGPFEPRTPTERLGRVVQDLNQAGIPTALVDNILTHIWGKVLYNCALNPLGAILGAPYGKLGEHPDTLALMEQVIEEIYRVAAAKGVALEPPSAVAYFRYFLDKLLPPTAAHWPSMWQDLNAGRRTEIEALNGAICRYGAETGVPTPANEVLSRLVRFLERR
ncbi:MAG: ketopantoate reductase family protein [Deltaproteobacteria bacterium]|nr:ketopantoate reductase family protein [Deltaproteobacteria bacterium]